jgi:hypothetical protein
MHNVYEQFKQLLSDPPLQVGTVSEIGTGVVTVQLPGGGTVKGRGQRKFRCARVCARWRSGSRCTQSESGNH